jgi:hypothetical protein
MLMHEELEEVQIVKSLLEMGGSSLGGEVMMVKRIVRSSSKITSPTRARRRSTYHPGCTVHITSVHHDDCVAWLATQAPLARAKGPPGRGGPGASAQPSTDPFFPGTERQESDELLVLRFLWDCESFSVSTATLTVQFGG